jgi:hypothetical protein
MTRQARRVEEESMETFVPVLVFATMIVLLISSAIESRY